VRRASVGRIDIFWNQSLAELSAKRLVEELKSERVDLAVCIGNAPLSAFLAPKIPTIHVSDATVPLMSNFYDEFSRLPKVIADSAWQLDCASVLGSRASLFSTEWAARSAIRDYGADPSRVHVIPWGANTEREATSTACAVPSDVCHLVFIGVDWRRKGGDIAVAAARQLTAAGHPVRLHIIGATPKLRHATDTIITHGFINKDTESGRLRFDSIMQRAAFLFVPSRQDCSPMVFAEANSYGVPIITTRTGGVADVVQEGVNGHHLSTEATAASYADLIWALWTDRVRYAQLRKSARTRSETVLNWNSWLSAAAPVIEKST
jgi:glycosyltransferase involved in cell wall biosynthesis